MDPGGRRQILRREGKLMNHKVHSIAGVVIAEGTLLYHGVPAFSFHTLGVMMCGYLAAMAPDLDKPGSFLTVHQPFRAISEGLSRLGPHRGPAHSIIALILVYMLFRHVIPLPDVYVWAIVLGFASHMFLDLFNAAGVMLLYPWEQDFKLLPSFMSVSSEDHSIGQLLLFSLFSMAFYGILASQMLEILAHTPLIGDEIARLRGWALIKTEFIWLPVVEGVHSTIQMSQTVIQYPAHIFTKLFRGN